MIEPITQRLQGIVLGDPLSQSYLAAKRAYGCRWIDFAGLTPAQNVELAHLALTSVVEGWESEACAKLARFPMARYLGVLVRPETKDYPARFRYCPETQFTGRLAGNYPAHFFIDGGLYVVGNVAWSIDHFYTEAQQRALFEKLTTTHGIGKSLPTLYTLTNDDYAQFYPSR